MYDPLKLEPEILEFWRIKDIHKKANLKNKRGKDFYFLDGPPYTSGKVHIGTAWNKSLKDCILRYKRMNGLKVWDRAGYDMHGLPTENAVQKKFKLKYKEDIEKLGVAKFVEECKKFSIDNMNSMNEDFTRLGVWMDFENAYQSIKDEFIEGVWWLVKKAHKNGRLYEGEKTMPWCASCATALAKHELEYQTVTDESIFLKFKLKNKENEYLIVWTTTPWTIPFNLAVMVNPEVDYVRAQVDDEVWIIARKLSNLMISSIDKKFKIIEDLKGEALEGLKYNHPLFHEIPDFKEMEKKYPKLHSVILSKEYVDDSSGSGLVHCAPGCGPEDYEVGHREKLPPYNELNEEGVFKKTMGKFSGWIAKKDDKKFIEELKRVKAVIAVNPVDHEYAHCWRCHEPVVYRTTVQWFFRIEDIKEKMKELNNNIYWVPNWAGTRTFHSWLDNLRDNSITKQRYWGTPLPVWKCSHCNRYDVIGSVKDLEKLSGQKPKDLHKPLIDEITIPCKCGKVKKRIPDVLDVWVDAGTVSWSCLDFPQRKDLFKKMYPADFILEGKDQIRGWFNILLIDSMVAMDNHSYKSVYMHGFVQDSLGRKMSKSLANYIVPEEVISKHGADTLRYYMIGGTSAGTDINYNFEDMELKRRNINVLWNLHKYLIDYSKGLKIKKKLPKLDVEEKYILSKLHSTIKQSTELYEGYYLNDIPWVVENLFLELSRTYVQFVRDKASVGSKKDKEMVVSVLYDILLNSLKLFAPIAPFVTEKIYQNLKNEFKLKEESIHLCEWPKYDEKLINEKLENEIKIAQDIIKEILAQRDKAQLGVRWPLPNAVITTDDSIEKEVQDIIKQQTNIKKIEFHKGAFKVELDTKLTPKLEREGFAREVTRRIQNLRKKMNLKKEDEIELVINSEVSLKEFEKEIRNKVGAKKILYNHSSFDNQIKEIIKNKSFEISFKKL